MNILLLLSISSAAAQTNSGIIEGFVRADAGGAPLVDVEVRARGIQTKTDAAGRYHLRDVPPGRHQVNVGGRRGIVMGSKTVVVASGQTVPVDFNLPLKGTISGRVLNELDEPVAGIEVALIGREYVAGSEHHFFQNLAYTNDEGEYRMQFVQPGIPYVVLFRKKDVLKLPAVSDAPSDPKLRRPTVVPLYYPGATDPQGGTVLILRGGEQREQINARIPRTASFCAEGVLKHGGKPAAMTFQIYESHLSFGISPSGGITASPARGETAADGVFRICELHPGEYRLTAFTGDVNRPDSLGTIPLIIRDHDLRNVTLQPIPKLASLPAEFSWAGNPPEKPTESKLGLSLRSASRIFGGFAHLAGASVPWKREFSNLLLDDYYVTVNGLAGRLYVKEILYGNDNITNAPLRVGSALMGASVKIAIGHDGAQLNARITDKDGNAIPHARVVVMPAFWGSDGDFAARSITGQSDQNGDYASSALMPGKYLIVAVPEQHFEWNSEFVAKLQAMRNHAQEISLEASATKEIKIVLR